MSKDPAVLLYTADFLTGTMTMSDEHVGMYIRLLCLQHQKGILTKEDMTYICKSYVKDVYDKFKVDEQENYYNERMKFETDKRSKYSESRRNNVLNRYHKKPKTKPTYVKHMENENINRNRVEIIYGNYPLKKGKEKGIKKILSVLKTDEDFNKFNDAVINYAKHCKISNTADKYIKHFSTFCNEDWRDWIEQPAEDKGIEAIRAEMKAKGIV